MKMRTIALIVALPLAVAACGTDTDSASPGATTAAAPGVTIEGAWARTSPSNATTGAAYMRITSSTTDSLVSAKVDASVAGAVEIHEVVPVGTNDGHMNDSHTNDSHKNDGHMNDGHMNDSHMGGSGATGASGAMGQMTMRPVKKIELPAGTPVELKPGGYHLMLLDLPTPLTAGRQFDLELTFDKAGTKKVSVDVRDNQ